MSEENKPQGSAEWLKSFDIALEDKVTCDGLTCSHGAAVYMKTRCCGEVIFACPDCLQSAQQTIIRLIAARQLIMCLMCGSPNSPRTWLTKAINL